MISYAQNLEDVVLNRVFRNKPSGFYIDVGAHDPVELSVTKHFYDLGWHGINIEPVPESFRNFEKQRPRDINLNLGISNQHDFLTLYEVVGCPELTSLDKDVARNASKIFDTPIKEYHVEVRTLAEVCEQYDVHFIDFIKIDVEGQERDVLAGADFERFRPTMLVVEATVPCSGAIKDWSKADDYANWHDWEPLVLDAGYLLVYYDGLNRYYLREEDQHFKSCFTLPIAVLQDEFTLYREVQERQRFQGEATTLKGRIGKLETDNQQLADAITALNREKAMLERKTATLKERISIFEKAQQQLSAQKHHLADTLTTREHEKTQLEGKATLLKERVGQLEQSKADMAHEAEGLKRWVGELKQEKAEMEHQAEGLKRQIGEVNQERADLVHEVKGLKRWVGQLHQEKADMAQEAESLKRWIDDLRQKAADQEYEAKGLKRWISELELEKDDLEYEARGLKLWVGQLGRDKDDLEYETEGLRQWVGQLAQEKSHLEHEAEGLKKEKIALEEERADLRKERRSLQNRLRYREKKQVELEGSIALLSKEKAGLEGLVAHLSAERDQLQHMLAQTEQARQLLQEEKALQEQVMHVLRTTLQEEHDAAQRKLRYRLIALFRSLFGRNAQAPDEPPPAGPTPAAESLPGPSYASGSETTPAALEVGTEEPTATDGLAREPLPTQQPYGEAVSAALNGTPPATLATDPATAALIEMHRETGEAYRLAQSRHQSLPEAPSANEIRMMRAAQKQANQSEVYRALKPVGKRVQRLLQPAPASQATNGSATLKPASSDLNGHGVRASINTSLIDALMETRSLPGAVPEQTLVSLYDLGQNLTHVLSLKGTSDHRQALHMLSLAGAHCTCLGCDPMPEGQSNGWHANKADLAQWLSTQGATALAAYDGLLLDADLDEATLNLLKGRLWPNTQIMVRGVLSDDGALPVAWGSPSLFLDGLAVYDAPPRGWLDAAHDQPMLYALDQWPATSKPITLPPTLPSGQPWPKISVVTVTLNQGTFLEDTIQSILGQGYPNLEYIILDGGSTDNTPAILDNYRDQLAYCVSEPDDGQSDALNKGFRIATGEILAWLNSDDKYPPGTFWRVALAFDTYAADIVAGGCGLFRGLNPEPVQTHHNSMPIGQVVPLPLDKLLDIDGSWLKGDFFYQPEVFWTRELWERCGSQVDENLFYSMDYELWVRMAQYGARILHIPETLALYRMHDAQKTNGADLPYVPELRQVNKALREQLMSS